jgi:hypothetical protein
MDQHQFNVIRKYIDQNPEKNNSEVAKIIFDKSRLGLSIGTLRKYIANVKKENKEVKSTVKGSISVDLKNNKAFKPEKVKRVKKEVVVEEPVIAKVEELLFDYSHIKDTDKINHIKSVIGELISITNTPENQEFIDELMGYGVILFTKEELLNRKNNSVYKIVLSDLNLDATADVFIRVNEYNHFYDACYQLLSTLIPTGAKVIVEISLPWLTRGTANNVNMEDAQFYLKHFKGIYEAEINVYKTMSDLELTAVFDGFGVDNYLEIPEVNEDEIDEEYEEYEDDFM